MFIEAEPMQNAVIMEAMPTAAMPTD